MSRPTKLTPARQKAIMRAIEQGATYEHAAAAAGIHYDTLNEWRKANPEFAEALKAAEARGVLACLRRIEEAAKSGQWQAAAWILERRYPEEYGRRDRVNVHHEGEVQLQATIEARTAVLRALVDFPEARLAVAAALEQLDESADATGDTAESEVSRRVIGRS